MNKRLNIFKIIIKQLENHYILLLIKNFNIQEWMIIANNQLQA